MLSKISVKKPMTVLVAVVLVLVLGIVSFFKMTPDLLPNMDFPYAVIMTTYAGQTPEAVETTVSKPLEQSMSAIDGVKEITSTSSDNYSLLMIEFEDGTNMDSATVDMRSSLDTIKGNWPDGVGTPYLIKINPNILPVAMTAVDFEGKSQTELSDYVTNELLNELEGIDGVASVSDKGIVTEQENVVLSQDKLRRFPLHSIINSVMRRTKLPRLKRNCKIISAKLRTVRVQFHHLLSKSTHSRRLFQNSLPMHRTRLKAVKHSFCRQRCSCLTERQALPQQRPCLKPPIRACLN